MKIVTDDNIPYLPEVLSGWGEVIALPGKQIDAGVVRDADLLFVRSRTPINASLLEGSRVRFVGTAVIGLDHVDQDYLARKNIAFASAAGCNANAVAEYVIAALLWLARHKHFRLAGKTIGIVGVGNVGSRLVQKAAALGMTVLQCDPPLARQTGSGEFLPLEDLLGADIITFHVPLTFTGPDTTHRLADDAVLGRLKKGAILLNTARGGVVDEDALKRHLATGQLSAVVLDAWQNEPGIDWELLRQVDIGTTHIAGHSLDGKINGTVLVYRAACRFLDIEPTWDPATMTPEPLVPHLHIAANHGHDEDAVGEAVAQLYDLQRDDDKLREIATAPPAQRGPLFEEYRREYPVRREFQHTRVTGDAPRPQRAKMLAGLGFQLA